jgi:hypothetical protein
MTMVSPANKTDTDKVTAASNDKLITDLEKTLRAEFQPNKVQPPVKLLEEIVKKSQANIAARIYDQGNLEESAKLLRALGEEIKNGCKLKDKSIVHGPVKSYVRADEKVKLDYGGDWYQLKDVVRMTIVAPNADAMKAVNAYIRNEACVARNGRGLPKAEPSDGVLKKTACGYTGYNFVALLENWRFGEIQLNVPGVMYGQMSPDLFEKIVGDKEKAKKYQEKYKVDGGLGHIYYELYRPNPAADIAKESAAISTKYFDHLRLDNPDAKAGEALQVELKAYAKKYEKQIENLHKKKAEAAKKQPD